MTENCNVEHYENICSGQQTIESRFHENLIEHLNSEIVLGTISTWESALNWIRSTFLYVRLPKNPDHYGVEKGRRPNEFIQALLNDCLKTLSFHKLILHENELITPLESGKSMAKYYIKCETMITISKLQRTPSTEQIVEFLNLLVNRTLSSSRVFRSSISTRRKRLP